MANNVAYQNHVNGRVEIQTSAAGTHHVVKTCRVTFPVSAVEYSDTSANE